MSLKDRLNLNKKEPTPIIDVPESAAQGMEIFKKLLNTNANILVSCPIDVPTHIALNFLGDKISKSKRIVAIGANLALNRNEFIRFEPQNSSNSSLNTALTLNPAKILLQEFCGMEATDIFKCSVVLQPDEKPVPRKPIQNLKEPPEQCTHRQKNQKRLWSFTEDCPSSAPIGQSIHQE